MKLRQKRTAKLHNIEYRMSKGGFARAAQALPLRQAPARRVRRVSLSLFFK